MERKGSEVGRKSEENSLLKVAFWLEDGFPDGIIRKMTREFVQVSILLIEDAQELAETVRCELENNGYRVWHAADGLSGLNLFLHRQPDLVILDWMMPGMDGLSVLQRIRKDSGVPILMLTARADEADRVIGLEVGADDYLTKPFSMRELLARVRSLLRRLEHIDQIRAQDRGMDFRPVVYGPALLDPVSFQASLNGQSLDLTRTEFTLLHLFLRNPGVTFNRAYLLDTVWGEYYYGGDRSVDSAVTRLRKKLGSFGDEIEAVWGVGYRLRKQALE